MTTKVLVVGASGVLGSAVVTALEAAGDEVIGVSRSTDPGVDVLDDASIGALLERVGEVDAVVATIGSVPFVATPEATTEQFSEGIAGKLMSQVSLVLQAIPHVRDGGSFTLTTGILGQHPIAGSVIAGTVNGGIESFVIGAATDLPRRLRINVVSPNVIEEALPVYGPYFPGFRAVPAAEAAQAYVRSVHGVQTGQVFRVW